MLERMIEIVFKNRLLVILFFVSCTGFGVFRMLHTARPVPLISKNPFGQTISASDEEIHFPAWAG